jgi:predicted MFS family arabinose efflux permease
VPDTQAFSNTPAINWLSAARFFLFGSRDVWFVVGLPVFLYEVPGWSFMQVGGFLALWVIGYGFVQAAAPMNVGFYYMANAGGRLAGTVLSGLVYQTQGLSGCLWWSAGFVLAAWALSWRLPEVAASTGGADTKAAELGACLGHGRRLAATYRLRAARSTG